MGAECTGISASHECRYPPTAMWAIRISTSLAPHSAHFRADVIAGQDWTDHTPDWRPSGSRLTLVVVEHLS